MEPSVVETATKAAKPAKWWILWTAIAGAAGSLGTVAAAGSGTYDVTPFQVRFEALPAPLGKTVLQVQPVEDLATLPLRAEAGTHRSPLMAKATIVGVSAGVVRSDRAALQSPFELASFLGQEGEDAIRSFAFKVGGLAIGGGAGAGLILSFGRWRRILGGALAGVLAFGLIGGLMQQTYDTEEFQKTSFVVEGEEGELPVDVPGDDIVPDVIPS